MADVLLSQPYRGLGWLQLCSHQAGVGSTALTPPRWGRGVSTPGTPEFTQKSHFCPRSSLVLWNKELLQLWHLVPDKV